MGRRNRRKTTRSDDTFDISSDSELLREFIQRPFKPPIVHLTPPTFDLRPLEDRRTWHPQPLTRPAGATKRSATQLVIPKPAKGSVRASLPHRVGFKAPPHVLVCVRRKQRREVLFAKRKAAAGARSRKHRNAWSNVKC